MKHKRPTGVKFLTILLFSLALWNMLRLAEAVFFWNVLTEYQARGGPLYLAVSGGVWAISAFVVGWAAWLGKRWAWGAMLGFIAGFGIWLWLDRLIYQTPRINNLFALSITVIGLMLILPSLLSKKVRDFYHER